MEKRKYSRTSLISDYNTQFRLGGQSYSNIHVANIGTNGCCLKLPIGTAKILKDKPNLENMILFHGGSRKYAMRGRVAWHEPDQDSKGKYLNAGVEFLETPQECSQEIAEYVKATRRK